MPDLAAEFDERGAEDGNAMAGARDDLMDTVTDAVTRSFRPAFIIAAALAALAADPGVVRRSPPTASRSAVVAHATPLVGGRASAASPSSRSVWSP